ncbi:alcohol dehydrogenase [Halarchaeum acidiphilum MH1-52-1]|uniref:Alcohol dehydrogenase n=1 Tax=Halarchaeum acidiphilum MH1-52-1 TaxID=1261545 RepID=U2YXE2_9EURY|nr:NAD(P)-dependent alcohol dehydrogenase [Halarchaeum acidiphilum]GAD53452.1 alcohol dehydrogenase [Halarchaeum acidiphilum MH1-52-1]
MRAYELREHDPDFEGLTITDRERPEPGPGEVLVRIEAASINYRDLAIAATEFGYPGEEYPMIPLCDGAGDVVGVGEGVERLEAGDSVVAPFFPDWVDGPGTPERTQVATGGNRSGTLAEYAVFPADATPKMPESLDYAEACTLTCAGLTAWTALVEHGDLTGGESVLCLGTGGVSTFALQFADAMGATPVVTSSSDAKLELAETRGADVTINYEESPEWDESVLEATDGVGVDHVVEVGGAGTLERSLEAVRYNGEIHLIGVLSEPNAEVAPRPILEKACRVRGVSVGSRAAFDRMARAIDANGIEPVVDRIFDFEDAASAYRYVWNGEHTGKVVIDV